MKYIRVFHVFFLGKLVQSIATKVVKFLLNINQNFS